MILNLINDLPLFGVTPDTSDADALVADVVARYTFPRQVKVEFVSFGQFESWWNRLVYRADDTAVLIGSRPNAWHQRMPIALPPEQIVHLSPVRRHGRDGRTESVTIARLDSERVNTGARVQIVDDVLMSGRTLHAVIAALDSGASGQSITAQLFLANGRSVERLRQILPEVRLVTWRQQSYEPIRDGTTIFLWDLFFGQLRGRPLIEQAALTKPYFGDSRAALLRMRDEVGHIAT